MAKKKVSKKAKNTSKKKTKKPVKKEINEGNNPQTTGDQEQKATAEPTTNAEAQNTEEKKSGNTGDEIKTQEATKTNQTTTSNNAAQTQEAQTAAIPATQTGQAAATATNDPLKEAEMKISLRRRIVDLSVNFWVLMAGLVCVPVAYLFLYLGLPPESSWLTYLALTDLVLVTALFFFRKTYFIAFLLNTFMFLAVALINAIYLGIAAVADFLFLIPDLVIGFILWGTIKEADKHSL